MSAEVLIASYLRIAREDLAGARQLASSGNRNAMYLCSQAAEKIIRAV
jgi:HEPN domain-containing protein